MSYKEYWQMDCELVRAYRKAYEYKQDLYIYRAMEAQRPGWAFYGKKPMKPEKYLEKPLAVTDEMRKQYAHEETMKMAEQFKTAFAARNKRMNTKKGDDSNGNN